ncbi:protein TBATA [Brachyhypopomus gauderio]|uniref:protein TBATA n=1 Tax=Brachyhypopomus gauderio TaxID=698409 RepID=UPI0040418B61
MESCGERVSSKKTPPNKSNLVAQDVIDLPRVTTRGSARFGNLSHHSFFSRHNPHPHRVTHISGLNGSPVCMVNDDWYANTPLFPHPLIRSQVPTSCASQTSLSLPYPPRFSSAGGGKTGAELLSEAWREELKDLATKVSQPVTGPGRDGCCRDEEAPRRKTQYSAQTGRLIPALSWGSKRRDTQASHRRPGTHRYQQTILGGQELRVLELLCQILQTDSLSLVQQWLLLAGDREKELVQGLLQQALADVPNLAQQEEQLPYTAQPELPLPEPSLVQSLRKRRLRSVCSSQEAMKEKPEMIGEAEVLPVHTAQSQSINTQDSSRQHDSQSIRSHESSRQHEHSR